MNLSRVDGSADEREKDPQVLASGDVMESQPTVKMSNAVFFWGNFEHYQKLLFMVQKFCTS